MMVSLHNIYRKKKASTLPEALITISILAFVILYFILAFTVGKYAIQLSKDRIIISNLLKAEMENALGSNYANLAAVSENITVTAGSKNISVNKALNLTVEDPDVYGYKKVYVKLEWQGGILGDKTLQEEAVMYVTKR